MLKNALKKMRDSIQKLYNQHQSTCTLQAETNLQNELDELLKMEESLCRYKAMTKWIQEGNANTQFFHITTIFQWRYNAINYILSPKNSWHSNRQDIVMTFQKYFSELFMSSKPQFSGQVPRPHQVSD